jgi:hypothetical protein
MLLDSTGQAMVQRILVLESALAQSRLECQQARELLQGYRESEDHAFCEDAGMQDGIPTRDVRCDLCKRTDAFLAPAKEPIPRSL